MKSAHHSGKWPLSWIKFFLFMTNVMFVFTAVLVISTGIAIRSVYSDFTIFIDQRLYSPALMFILVGSITLAFAIFGFVGTIKESAVLINIYSGLLSVVFVLELTATLVGFYHRQDVSSILVQTLNNSIQQYPWNNHVQKSVDFMQIELECCGVSSFRDWEDVLVVERSGSDSLVELPASCCITYNDGACVPYAVGCYPKMNVLLRHCSKTIATGLLLVAFVQISAAMFAFMLGKRIRLTKTRSSLDALKYQSTVCSFDYKRFHEVETEASQDQSL
ncbi:CD63 antigen-like [Toxorhynchites rutilus septentrionalis]|uniref:CD63 antigen-like n=1 Tax=Toxorhynchites rutilus septentrionalis TaxID=329112 RepID=UPI002479FDA0|nr:CD63 antigen-like [Toxorhynchites rutilus septentrionalis]